jgi:hypothetical protein
MSGRPRRRDPTLPALSAFPSASRDEAAPVPSVPAQLSSLRQLLAARFPQAARPADARLLTGIPSVDEATGGLPRSALTELVSATPHAGAQLFLAQLLAVSRALPSRAALIDASDQFDPGSIPDEHLEHLLWIRCRSLQDALPAADILARDANFDLILLDLAAESRTALRRIPAHSWYRLQRAVEQTHLAFLILTPVALVPSAQLRLELVRAHDLSAQNQPRPQLAGALQVTPQRQRLAASA